MLIKKLRLRQIPSHQPEIPMTTLHTSTQQYLTYCRYHKNLSDLSLKAYEIDLKRFVAYAGARKSIRRIDKHVITGYVQHLFEEGLKSSSVKRRIACLKAMFRWLEFDEQIEINPFHKVDLRIKLPHQLPRNLSTDQLQILMTRARQDIGLRTYHERQLLKLDSVVSKGNFNQFTTLCAMEILYCTGIRVGELVGITLQDLDLVNGQIKIRGKGHRERKVFLPDQDLIRLLGTYQYLRSRLFFPDHSEFLLNSRGKPASTQFIRKLLKELSERCGMGEHATPHMCRHSTATELLNAGVDIRFVQKLMGHQSITTTQRYTHVSDEELKYQISAAGLRGGLKKS